MTHRTHAVAKTRSHQVRWSSRCRSRAAGAEAGSAAGSRGAAAAGRGRTAQLRLSSASTLVVGSPQLQRSSHALLRPQESKCNACKTHDWYVIHESYSSSALVTGGGKRGSISEALRKPDRSEYKFLYVFLWELRSIFLTDCLHMQWVDLLNRRNENIKFRDFILKQRSKTISNRRHRNILILNSKNCRSYFL